MDKLQVAQNNLLKSLEHVRVSDKISVKSMLEKNYMLLVNQTHAQIKLIEMWKCKNNDSYPIKPVIMSSIENGLITRSVSSEHYRLNDTPNTFIGDATRLWNSAPNDLKKASTLYLAKKLTKNYCRNLAI